MVKIIKYIEITAWLVSVYDFYVRVVKDRKRTSERSEQVSLANLSQQVHNENCTNEPTIQPSQLFSSSTLIFFAVQQKIPAKLTNDVSTWKEV